VNLPPQTEAPSEVRALINRHAELSEELAASAAAMREAEAAVREAAALDRQALADARDAGAEHPGHPHRDAAEQALADATEVAEADRLRLTTCEDGLRTAIEQQAPEWIASIEHARERSDREFRKAVDKLRQVEGHRAALRSTQVWLTGLGQVGLEAALERGVRPSPGRTTLKDPYNADTKMPVPTLLDVLEAYAGSSSVEGERRAAEEHAQAEAEAEQRRQEIAAFRGTHAPLHVR
jgi:hypothetical protein